MAKLTLLDRLSGGIWGLLVGDACGVPYEFRAPEELPPLARLDMVPPPGYLRSYSHIPLGTWSDDGAQALCLLASLLDAGTLDLEDFGNRLLAWYRQGYMAVDGHVFDVGIQTSQALRRLENGVAAADAGLRGDRNNGNGSLMRVLPLALWHTGDDAALMRAAHHQSLVTHGHVRSQVCCALYCLWARAELYELPMPWDWAVSRLEQLYVGEDLRDHLAELHQHVLPTPQPIPTGSGYVVDCLHSAHLACQQPDYAAIVRAAIALGHDTDTTACVAGGIAGIRHGVAGIPVEWRARLREPETVEPLVASLCKVRR